MTLEELKEQQDASNKQERINNGERNVDDLIGDWNSKSVNLSDKDFKFLLLEIERSSEKNIERIKFWVQLWSIVTICGIGIWLISLLVALAD